MTKPPHTGANRLHLVPFIKTWRLTDENQPMEKSGVSVLLLFDVMIT